MELGHSAFCKSQNYTANVVGESLAVGRCYDFHGEDRVASRPLIERTNPANTKGDHEVRSNFT
eukprot:6204503-Pleurochrysis_carterae.AAC.2